MRIIMNGTTITGSVSEVLATLTHLGFKASDTTAEVTANDTAKSVTMPLVTEIAVTDPEDMEKVAESIVAAMHEGERVLTPVATATPKLTRDGVIQQAISDVEALLSENYNDDKVKPFIGESLWFASKGVFGVTDEVLFTVNDDKRTVIAVIRHNKGHHKVLSKGRAKCAPGDVFNEHIGKAIALRRALGLEVPVEYFEVEARDSDDLAVGDLVSDDEIGCDAIYEITKLIDNPNMSRYPGRAFVRKGGFGWLASSQVTLINDSARHTAPDLEVSRIIRH